MTEIPARRLRICAVSYLNTTPLVWGLLHGSRRGAFDLDFRIPSECADRVVSGEADVGIVPSIEVARHGLEIIRGTGIACDGPVRSILLISSVPASEIRTLSADSSSRTSVELARIILQQRFQARPEVVRHAPDLESMLRQADAALIIGDPALRIHPGLLPYHVYDLGAEWVAMTGKPMVFAVWAGRKDRVTPEMEEIFAESCRVGRINLEEIISLESARREFDPDLVREYLTRHIVHELGAEHYAGMDLFLRYAQSAAPRV